MTENELQMRWQSQAIETPKVSIDYLLYRTSEFQRLARREDIGAYIALALSTSFFAWACIFMMHTILGRVVSFSILAYCIYGAYEYRKTYARPAEQFENNLDALTFYRQQLQWKQQARRWNWLYVIPGIILTALLLVAQSIGFPEFNWLLIPQIVGALILFSLAYIENRRMMRKLQAEIDALATLG